MVERLTFNQTVAGSNPVTPSITKLACFWVNREDNLIGKISVFKIEFIGSSPIPLVFFFIRKKGHGVMVNMIGLGPVDIGSNPIALS